MSIGDLKLRLRDVPGIETLTMTMQAGCPVYALNGHTVAYGTSGGGDDHLVENAIRAFATLPGKAADSGPGLPPAAAIQSGGASTDADLVTDPHILRAATAAVIQNRFVLDINNPRPLSPEVNMPGIGAGKSVRETLAAAKADVASALNDFAKAVTDKNRQLAQAIRSNGALVIQKMDDDHAETVSAFTEMLGNEHAGADAEEKNDTTSGGSSNGSGS